MDIAIVGATGNVGRKTLEVLQQKNLNIDNLYLVASPNSAGKQLEFNGKKYLIEFNNGEAKKPLKEIGKSKESGTQITFLPSKEIFQIFDINT